MKMLIGHRRHHQRCCSCCWYTVAEYSITSSSLLLSSLVTVLSSLLAIFIALSLLRNRTVPFQTMNATTTIASTNTMNVTYCPAILDDTSTNTMQYRAVNGRDDLIIKSGINTDTNTITIQLVYSGLGWIGIAFADTMVPAVAMIGTLSPPDGTSSESRDRRNSDSSSITNRQAQQVMAGKYYMDGYTMDYIHFLNDPFVYTNTISNNTRSNNIYESHIVQNRTHTVFSVTRSLRVPTSNYNELDIDISSTEGIPFIWAIGSTSPLSMHSYCGNDIIPYPYNLCGIISDTSEIAVNASPLSSSDYKTTNTSASENEWSTIIDGLYIKMFPNEINQTITIEMLYFGKKWISIGISTDGKMIGSQAIIGSTSDPLPTKYDMCGYTMDTVQRAPIERQTLIDAVFEQNDTHTYMKFTKLLQEPNFENPIVLHANNTFIYAIGKLDEVSMHVHAGKFVVNPSEVGGGKIQMDISKSHRTVWLIHGICMVLAWVFLIPAAVGCSLFRSLLPTGPFWLQLHTVLNMFGVLLTLIGFITSVVVVQQEGKKHFVGIPHYKAGLILFLFSLFQAFNGLLKPSAPSPQPSTNIIEQPTLGSQTTINNESINDTRYDDEDGDASGTNQSSCPVESSPPGPPHKSFARSSWEVYHRILGFTMVGISWYNCDSGFQLYNQSYEEDYSKALWGVIGGVCCLFVLTYTYQKTK